MGLIATVSAKLNNNPHQTALPANLGSISQTYLHTAFMRVAPKSIRIQSSCLYLFTLLGSLRAIAERSTLMKLTLEWKHN